jgi:hypothetical protein
LLDQALVLVFVRQAKAIEERVLDFESATSIALHPKDFAVDDASYLRTALTERANPQLLTQFEPEFTDRSLRRPILLNGDLKARESGVGRTIPKTGHPRAVGQLTNFQNFDGIGNVQLPEYVGRKTLQLKSFNSNHADRSFSRFVMTGPQPRRDHPFWH